MKHLTGIPSIPSSAMYLIFNELDSFGSKMHLAFEVSWVSHRNWTVAIKTETVRYIIVVSAITSHVRELASEHRKLPLSVG